MLTPTVNELPRALEAVGRDTFLSGADHAATLVAAALVPRSSPERDARSSGTAVVSRLAA